MLLHSLYYVGIIADAMTAALAAGRQRMDLFGVIMLAEVTAFGGGTVRNIVLGHYPLTWVGSPHYLLVVLAAALITISINKLMVYFRTIFLTADAIGLAVFTVMGMNVALQMGYGYLISLAAAVITGVFGGLLRDIFSNRVPLVFQKELYAMAVFVGVTFSWILRYFNVNTEINTILTLIVVFAVRMLSLKFGWSLPVFEYQEREITRSPATQIWQTVRSTPARVRENYRKHREQHHPANGSDESGRRKRYLRQVSRTRRRRRRRRRKQE